jgi:hypothetical protein
VKTPPLFDPSDMWGNTSKSSSFTTAQQTSRRNQDGDDPTKKATEELNPEGFEKRFNINLRLK